MADAVTIPDHLEMIIGEQLNLQIDFTNVIAVGDVISAPVVLMTAEGTDEPVASAIIGSPSITGSAIMNVTVSSVTLRSGTDYVLTLSCTATGGAQSKFVSALLVVRVIY